MLIEGTTKDGDLFEVAEVPSLPGGRQDGSMTPWTAPEAHRETEPTTGPERALLKAGSTAPADPAEQVRGLTGEQLKTAAVEPSHR